MITNPLNKLDRVNPEVFDIAQSTVALAICMTCTLHAGYAEAQQHNTKALALVLLALPAAAYIINKPKPRIYQFGETLKDFQPPENQLGSDQTDLPTIEVGCSHREAIETGSEDALQNETTRPETSLAVTLTPKHSDAPLPLAASFQPRMLASPGMNDLLRTIAPVMSRLVGLMFTNPSTTIGAAVIVLLAAVGIFA